MTKKEFNATPNNNLDKEIKQLAGKIITMSGYIITMRSENLREAKKTEDTLKILVRQTYDIRGGVWICLITIWFLALLVIKKNT